MPFGARTGLLFLPGDKVQEPAVKRIISFVDGQNLFHAARERFGCTAPDYDVRALAASICQQQAWHLAEVRFYTGVPERIENAFWHDFWASKLRAMSRQGIVTFSRPLRYRTKSVVLPGGGSYSYRTAEEKGIDVRIALDVIRLAHHHRYDVALIFSQDQDLAEAAQEIRAIACEQDRWIKVASAFPADPSGVRQRGINGTDWHPIDRKTYNSCRDPYDHRPRER